MGPGHLGMAGYLIVERPFQTDRPVILIFTCKTCIMSLYTIRQLSEDMIPCNTTTIYGIVVQLNAPGQLGMGGHLGMEAPFQNNRPMVLVEVYN